MKYLALCILLLAACQPEVSPVVPLEGSACEGYRWRSTVDASLGYTTLTVVSPLEHVVTLTFKRDADGVLRLEHASKGSWTDVEPLEDTRLQEGPSPCFLPGPGDASTDPCLRQLTCQSR